MDPKPIKLFVWADMTRYKRHYDSFVAMGATFLGAGSVPGFKMYRVPAGIIRPPQVLVTPTVDDNCKVSGDVFEVSDAALLFAERHYAAPTYARIGVLCDYLARPSGYTWGPEEQRTAVVWMHYFNDILPAKAEPISYLSEMEANVLC